MNRVPAHPHTFIDGPGHTASGEQVMDDLDNLRDTYNDDSNIGTVLPSSPEDGREFNLKIEDGTVWKMRYNAASTLDYKWDFVGGGPDAGVEAASEPPGNWGPNLGVPYDGIYVITYGHTTWFDAAGTFENTLVLRNAGGPVSGPLDGSGGDPGCHYIADAPGLKMTVMTVAEVVIQAGIVSLTFSSTGGTPHSDKRTMSIVPRCLA